MARSLLKIRIQRAFEGLIKISHEKAAQVNKTEEVWLNIFQIAQDSGILKSFDADSFTLPHSIKLPALEDFAEKIFQLRDTFAKEDSEMFVSFRVGVCDDVFYALRHFKVIQGGWDAPRGSFSFITHTITICEDLG